MKLKIKYKIRKNYIMKKNGQKFLQKQNNRYKNYKELFRSYVEIENKLKMMEENLKINDSEKH